jgi:Ricin-type beta-trefoil lectin domain-like
MANYAYIRSKLNGNVIDIQGVSPKPATPLDAYPQKAPNDNQLWILVPDSAGSDYYFIKSKLNGNVIDIAEASTKAGALLDAYPQKTSNYDNQLWKIVADGNSGYSFIQSKLNGNVIDIVEASTKEALLNFEWVPRWPPRRWVRKRWSWTAAHQSAGGDCGRGRWPL